MENYGKESVTAIIVAGGEGVRLGQKLPKPLVTLYHRPLVSYSLETFEKHPEIDHIILVCGKDWLRQGEALAREYAPVKTIAVVAGGRERVDSVKAGMKHLAESCTVIAIHDAARPFVSPELIGRTLRTLAECSGVVPGQPLVDTLRKQEGELSQGARNRSEYILTQTPQCFRRAVLLEAFRRAEENGFSGTDDAAYVERLPGARVAIVEGHISNFKITTPEDLMRAETMLDRDSIPDFRCGEGFDAHRFTVGRKLILGGKVIPFDLGLHGHSDADVLCHAIGDALLGAVALGDLGKHFPDSDPAYEGISSIRLLAQIRQMVTDRGYAICNVDATLVVQLPKIAPHREDMRSRIAESLELDVERVSVKATTTEGMGPFGRGEGIACRAVALVVKK